MRTKIGRWLPLLALVGVLLIALAVGATRRGPEPTVAQRAQAIAREVKCPVCVGESVAESKATTARAIYQEIERRVGDGQSKAEVLDYLATRYGRQQLLNPPRTGVGGLVWVIPVVVLVVALAGLALAFRRWKAEMPTVAPSVGDQVLVSDALRDMR